MRRTQLRSAAPTKCRPHASPCSAGRRPASSRTSMLCRLIVDGAAGGPWNMAVDETLLESAAASGAASLRFYGWSEPTLSLGYFQRAAARQTHATSLGCPMVRRPSGGGAILHDWELTY